MLSNIHLGAQVHGFNDEHLGTIKYLVADPNTDQISHFVVERDDRAIVVEAGRIESVGDGGRVQLNMAGSQLNELPDFIEREYVNTNVAVSAGSDVPLPAGDSLLPNSAGTFYPVAGSQFQGGAPGNSVSPAIDPITDPIIMGTGVAPVGAPYDEYLNVPEDALIIKQGAKVEALDGHIGSVKDVNLDPTTGGVVSFVVAEGFLFTHDVTVPIDMVDSAELDTITLNVNKSDIAR